MSLSKEIVLGITRHAMTCIGGILTSIGWDTGDWEAITGIVMTISGLVWSLIRKIKRSVPVPDISSPNQ